MKKQFILFIFGFSCLNVVKADEVRDLSELALLPPYCSGVRQIRSISKDQRSIEDYVAAYGNAYNHLHHYCWALNAENIASRMRDKFLRESKLGYALGDVKYVLDRAETDFILLPEIYTSQARMLFSLRRESEAVLALKKAIMLKVDYVPAILQLSDYYSRLKDTSSAIKVLEDGISNTENADQLIKKLKKHGKSYDGIPGSARKQVKQKEELANSVVHEGQPVPNDKLLPEIPVINSEPSPPTGIEPVSPINPTTPTATPHCRFCP